MTVNFADELHQYVLEQLAKLDLLKDAEPGSPDRSEIVRRLKIALKIAPSAAAWATAFAMRLFAIWISVRPLAVTCATMKASKISIHKTIISANPSFGGRTTGYVERSDIVRQISESAARKKKCFSG